MQLSLLDLLPGLEKHIFLDVFAKVMYEPRSKKPFLVTIEGQQVPPNLRVRCPRSAINQFPSGTIYKLDVKLVKPKRRSTYFSAVKTKQIQRSLEFFDHNLRIQNGSQPNISPLRPRVVFLRN